MKGFIIMGRKDEDEKTRKKKDWKVFIWGVLIGLIILIIFGNPITASIEYIMELFQ